MADSQPGSGGASSNHCAQCQKPGDASGLKRCAKCHSVRYCSRECQKAHWKAHKKACALTPVGSGTHIGFSQADAAAHGVPGQRPRPGETESAFDLDRLLATFSGNLGNNPPKAMRDAAYLNSLSKDKAHKVIVDSYRLRVEDEYVFRQETRGLYDSEDPFPDFVDYLDRAEAKGGILPQWWDKRARDECEKLAQDKNGDCFVGYAVEKEDIIKEYNDRLAPMRLRMIAQLVEGSRPDGT